MWDHFDGTVQFSASKKITDVQSQQPLPSLNGAGGVGWGVPSKGVGLEGVRPRLGAGDHLAGRPPVTGSHVTTTIMHHRKAPNHPEQVICSRSKDCLHLE